MITRSQYYVLLAGLAVLGPMLFLAGWKLAYGVGQPPLANSLADGRIGKLRFTSYSAEWWELPAGAFRKHPVDVPAELLLPAKAASVRVPAVILLHGSDGLNRLQYRYADAFLRWGMAVLVIDSFSARGVHDTLHDPGSVTPYSMLLDAYQALALLQTHPGIDAKRIALVGWSKGGMVADWATRVRYQSMISPRSAVFAAHAAFYPWCGEQHLPIQVTGAPLLYLVGAKDDWTGAQPCMDYVERLRAAGAPVKLSIYPHAEHGFDYPGRFRRYLGNAVSWANCNYIWGEASFQVVSSGETLPWSQYERYLAKCTGLGAHVGSNVVARAQSLTDLRVFLVEALGLSTAKAFE
jgi:dienelactone hydrolase